MNSSAPHEITFRPVEEQDFPILAAWLAQPHVRRFYQKTPVTLEEVASEYGPCVRGEEPSICHLASSAGNPFAYLQCYRNADYREWADLIGVDGGISLDLFIGDSTCLRKGWGGPRCVDICGGLRFHITIGKPSPISPTSRGTRRRSDALRRPGSVPCAYSWKMASRCCYW